MHRALLVTDGSANALRAARIAVDLVQGSCGDVVVIYVIPPVPTLAKSAVSRGDAELNDIVNTLRDAMRKGHNALTQAANILTQAGVSYTARLEQGIPASMICQIARQEHCDVIVIGSGDLDRTAALSFGTATRQTDGCASCAVVIVS